MEQVNTKLVHIDRIKDISVASINSVIDSVNKVLDVLHRGDFTVPGDLYVDNKIVNDKVTITPEGGIAIKLINGTGTTTVKGSLVAAAPATDFAFVLQANTFDSIGVVYESGVPVDNEALVVVAGIADVLFNNASTAATRDYILLASDTDGRATCIDTLTVNPVVAEHFKECGHTLMSTSAGTDVLVRCVLHFN